MLWHFSVCIFFFHLMLAAPKPCDVGNIVNNKALKGWPGILFCYECHSKWSNVNEHIEIGFHAIKVSIYEKLRWEINGLRSAVHFTYSQSGSVLGIWLMSFQGARNTSIQVQIGDFVLSERQIQTSEASQFCLAWLPHIALKTISLAYYIVCWFKCNVAAETDDRKVVYRRGNLPKIRYFENYVN